MPRALNQGPGSKATPNSGVQRLNRAPVNKEVLRVKLPRPSVHKLANGLTVLVLERHKVPTVNFELWIGPGAIEDPVPGMAMFTANMLREGTKTRSSAQIAAQVDEIGASLGASAPFGVSETRVSASGLTDSREKLLDLMSDVVLYPSFPADELEKYKEREFGDLEEQLSRPSFLAEDALRHALYGATNLGSVAPKPETIKSITPAALAQYHDKFYDPASALLGIVGDVQTAEILKLVEQYFGPWSPTAAVPEQKLKVPPPEGARVILVDRPGSVQTNIVAGELAVERAASDYIPLSIMNRILGGGPSGRLFVNLREEKGYTYGAYSRVFAETYKGFWAANTEVRNAVTDGSLRELLNEFRHIREQLVPADELDEARRSMVASFALSLERPTELLNDWMTVQHFGLPENYWDEYPERVAAVDAAKVQSVAQKYVDPDHLQIVCVGDAKQIKDIVAKYGKLETRGAAASSSGE